MNLCINLDKDDFSLNSYELNIKKWIQEIEKFYFEIKTLLEKLKKLEIKMKNNYENFDEIRDFLIKTKFLTNESLLLNFNRDYFSSLKEYITGLQKSFHLEKNTNAISNKEEIQKLDTIKQREITDRGDLFQRKDSSNDSSIIIPKYYLDKLKLFIMYKYNLEEEVFKTRSKIYYSAISSKNKRVLIKAINKEKSNMNQHHRTLSSFNVLSPQPEIINLIEARDIDDELMILVYDYADCNLEDFINTNHNSGLNDMLLFYMFYQVYSGIKNIHNSCICLKSLSPKNVLIVDYSLKISRFSDSINIKHLKNEDCNFWKKFDVFCLGYILYYLIFATYPFTFENKDIDISIIEIDSLIQANQKNINADLRLLVVKLMANYEDRFNLLDVEQCKWYTTHYQKFLKVKQYYNKQTNEFLYNYFKFEK